MILGLYCIEEISGLYQDFIGLWSDVNDAEGLGLITLLLRLGTGEITGRRCGFVTCYRLI